MEATSEQKLEKVGIYVEFTVTYSGYYQIEVPEEAPMKLIHQRLAQERERWKEDALELLDELCGSYSQRVDTVELGLE